MFVVRLRHTVTETHLYPRHNNSLVHLTTTTKVRHSGSLMEFGVVGVHHETPYFHSRHGHLPCWNCLPRTGLVRLNHLRTRVGRFRSCLAYTNWIWPPSATCECGAEEQTVDHDPSLSSIQWPSYGTHGLTVLDDETIEWLLSTCPEV